MKKTILAAAALAALTATAALAQGYGYGPGMMGRGYGPGSGYGGPGMMGPGYGYGPGSGYGPGMMGPGYGGYGRGGGLAALNLTDEQRDKVFALQEENRAKHWGTMGKLRSETFKLRGMYNSDKLDANGIAEQQKKVDELRREMLKSRVESAKQIESILTPEQRKQLRQYGPWWLSEDDEG